MIYARSVFFVVVPTISSFSFTLTVASIVSCHFSCSIMMCLVCFPHTGVFFYLFVFFPLPRGRGHTTVVVGGFERIPGLPQVVFQLALSFFFYSVRNCGRVICPKLSLSNLSGREGSRRFVRNVSLCIWSVLRIFLYFISFISAFFSSAEIFCM